jgi:hypothetical protein
MHSVAEVANSFEGINSKKNENAVIILKKKSKNNSIVNASGQQDHIL